MPVEGMRPEQIARYAGRIIRLRKPVLVYEADGTLKREDEFGKLKFWTKDLPAGAGTDDTVLSLSLVETLITAGVSIREIAQDHAQTYAALQAPGSPERAFGITTQKALRRVLSGIPGTESGVEGGAGNGPAMKAAPLALYLDATGNHDRNYRATSAATIGRITHRDPRSVISGIVQTEAVYLALRENDRDRWLESLVEISRRNYICADGSFTDRGMVSERLSWYARHHRLDDDEIIKELGTGSLVTESFPFTIAMVHQYWNRPFEGLIATVNAGGDCDTTGAMYGAIMGARHGPFWPISWEHRLEYRERFEAAAKRLEAIAERYR
jgi:ADP-ribosylglycohydrolase